MPHPVDIEVGRRLRVFRHNKGMTQAELADKVGIRFQQIQKYETGANRVSASRLCDIAKVLEVPVASFFDGILPDIAPPDLRLAAGFKALTPSQRSAVQGVILAMLGQQSEAAA